MSKTEVFSLFKNCRKLPEGIKVRSDCTKYQLDFAKFMREECKLHNELNSDDPREIKFHGSVPGIDTKMKKAVMTK